MSQTRQYSIALVVISDRASAGVRDDKCQPALEKFLKKNGLGLAQTVVIADEVDQIGKTVSDLADGGQYDLVLTAGGTGLSLRDVTPEATEPILDRLIPGIPEAMRLASLKITANAMLSRGVAGIRGRCMIVNLPGSPKAAVENLDSVFKPLLHGVDKAAGDMSDCLPLPPSGKA